MSYRNRTVALASLCLASVTCVASGQSTSQIVQGADGVTYQETRTITQRMLPTTEYQTRQEQVYTPQTSTTYQTYQQTHLTPVTEYRWVSRRRGLLNPFSEPYWQHQLEPVTRWESRPATVQVPVTSTQWVAGTRTVQTPVTTYKAVNEEVVSRVAISVAPVVRNSPPLGASNYKAIHRARRASGAQAARQRIVIVNPSSGLKLTAKSLQPFTP
jgi:hypothetical protein